MKSLVLFTGVERKVVLWCDECNVEIGSWYEVTTADIAVAENEHLIEHIQKEAEIS